MSAMAPTIRYATTADGARIACASLGEGPPLLCVPPFPFTDLEAGWGIAGQRAWYERLGAHLQVGLYDARGTGLSDRDRPEFDLDAMALDLDAVAERLGWDTFALCALFNGAPVAAAYAALRPERVTSLILWGGFARGRDVIPMSLPPEAPDLAGVYWGMFVKSAAQMWTAGSTDADEIAEFFQRCVTPEAALRAFATVREYDISELLPRVRDIRRMGAAALDLCSVAAGRVDVYFEVGLSPWDIAAGSLVAEEAGARVAAIDGGPLGTGSVLAAHPALFDEVIGLLDELGAASV